MSFVHTATATKDELFSNPLKWQDLLYANKVLVLKGLTDLSMNDLWDIHTVFGVPWTKTEYALSFEAPTCMTEGKWVTDYSNIGSKGRIGDKVIPWHHDIPWHREKRYPIRSLYPTKLTPGAELSTNFCDADAVWAKLSKAERFALSQADVRIQYWYEACKGTKDVASKVIPLVEKHPHTGAFSVMLNSFGVGDIGEKIGRPDLKHSTSSTGAWIIDCWSRSSHLGLEFINRLHELALTEDNIYEHVWELGDLVLFDNSSGVFHGRERISQEGVERAFWRMNLKHYWQVETWDIVDQLKFVARSEKLEAELLGKRV